jgi:hypothetical protein
MNQPAFDLSQLFRAAMETMTTQRQEINALDGYNGNHGDNMVENLRLITEALDSRRSQPPSEALRYASQRLQSQGRGGTSQYYARGLNQAAEQLQGRSMLETDDAMSLVRSLLGAIPSEGHPQQIQASGSVLEQVLGLPGAQPQPEKQEDNTPDVGDVLTTLLPAGLAFLQAKQTGADTASAIGQALSGALIGGQMNPLQSSTPRGATGSLIAQSILQALTSRR